MAIDFLNDRNISRAEHVNHVTFLENFTGDEPSIMEIVTTKLNDEALAPHISEAHLLMDACLLAGEILSWPMGLRSHE